MKNLGRKTGVLILAVLMVGQLSSCGRRSAHNTSAPRRNNSSGGTGLRRRGSSSTTQTPTVPESQQPGGIPAVNPTEGSREPLIYNDSRVPNYSGAEPQWGEMIYKWSLQDGGQATMTIELDTNMYQYYRHLTRYRGVENLYRYVNDTNNQEVIREVVDQLRQIAEMLQYDDAAVAREMAGFVQGCITYRTDLESTGEEEYYRYPLETLYEGQGDCEDTSILMAALLKEWGYEVAFIHLPGHIAVGIRTADDYQDGSYYEMDGHRYMYIESTASGWKIGDIPEEYRSMKAIIYKIP